MVKRLSSERQLAKYQGIFVPLKITTGSPEWRRWASTHGAPGNGIPIVYVVRADGEVLYSRTGSMPGNELYLMINKVIGNSGVILNDQQLSLVTREHDNLKKAVAENDLIQAIKIIQRIEKKRLIFDAECHATPYTELQQSIKDFTNAHFDGTLDGCRKALQFHESFARRDNRIRGLKTYVRALGEQPDPNMVNFGWQTIKKTDLDWTSKDADRVVAKLVSMESENQQPVAITLQKKNGAQIGPLPLDRFADDSQQLAKAIFPLFQWHENLPDPEEQDQDPPDQADTPTPPQGETPDSPSTDP